MSVKLIVLYPTPTDPEQFDRRYEREHLPMGKASLIGATGLATHRVLGSPAGKSPFARLTEVKSDPVSWDTVWTTMTAAKEAGHEGQGAKAHHDSWQ
jgi:uncharacterized protein (TIGR02118 family)